MKSTVSMPQSSQFYKKNSTNFIFPILTVLFVLLSGPSRAQVTLSMVSLDAGITENHQHGMGNAGKFAFYPEAGLGGLLYGNYVEWSVNFGYWNDGVNTPFHTIDQATYSFSSLTLKSKIKLFPGNAFEHFKLPVHFLAGLSINRFTREYIGGFDYTGSHLPSRTYDIPAFDLGLGLNMKLLSTLRLRAEGELYFPLSSSNSFPDHSSSASFKLGIDYYFQPD